MVQNEINNLSFLTGDNKSKMSKVAFVFTNSLSARSTRSFSGDRHARLVICNNNLVFKCLRVCVRKKKRYINKQDPD